MAHSGPGLIATTPGKWEADPPPVACDVRSTTSLISRSTRYPSAGKLSRVYVRACSICAAHNLRSESLVIPMTLDTLYRLDLREWVRAHRIGAQHLPTSQ